MPLQDNMSQGPLSPPTPSTASLGGRSSNPLSSKVATVLSTSYADSDFRESLGVLDQRNVSSDAETRRKLRLDVQKEVIESNGGIIAEFGRVAEQLQRIGATIDRLNHNYQDMKSHVTTAHEKSSSTLEEASFLMRKKYDIETKQRILESFREHFVLSKDEVASLTLSAEPVDDLFFLALVKAKRIRKDCEILLGFENQTLGLDVMEHTTKTLNQAFQKLYRWIQKEFKTLNLENPQINVSIRRALRVLAERPSLFQSCLDFFAEAREQILSDAFYLALTGTGNSDAKEHSVKPIELLAHDPLRYVGDMLAWAHSATVSEREALEALFVSDGNEIAKGIQEGRENDVWRLMAEEGETGFEEFNALKALNELVDRDVSGAARILRQRIEQVIQTNEETILSYKLANLLGFYKFMLSKLLSQDAVLLQFMNSLESEALRQFRSLMRDHIATLQSEFQHTPSDLAPPDFLQDSLEQLTAILRTHETSLASSLSDSDREADFQPVLAESFEPFLTGCTNMASTIAPPDRSIFLINCCLSAKKTLDPFAFTSSRAASLQATINEHAARLVDTQYDFFRSESSLEPLFEALGSLSNNKEDIAKIPLLPAAQIEALARASQGLDDFLPSAVMDAMENVKHLQDATLARTVTEEAADRFCVDFEHVEEMLLLADEMAEQGIRTTGEQQATLRAVFPRTTGEIRVLLS
ncbi:oligomeric Golgi complex subunit 6 [Xylariaceae sp. FL0016]|nr:oligomeric Golgi complex subunit 6 [Xylariaceae sp. FL0016]